MVNAKSSIRILSKDAKIWFRRMNMQSRFGIPAGAIALALGLSLATPALAAKSSFVFAGQPIHPGETVRANVPLSAQERQYASERGNVPPAQAVAVIAVPPGFDPHKTWPVLVIFATDDFKHLNRDDLVQIYRRDALAQGYVVLAGDGPKFPAHGTSAWRAGMTLAALEAMYRSFPGSSKWPVACAGYSGGAKQTGDLAPLLALAGCRMMGIYLTGINVDRLSPAYLALKPGRAFLHTPVFISVGREDKVAPPYTQAAVAASLRKTGFERVRLETFLGPHVVKRTHLQEALQWFRSFDRG
jgi:pimeloyl-ACP methyl ester carboxylesterase